MAFSGGPIGTLGITPSFLTGLATVATSSAVPQAIGQIWQGSGQSFYGQAGQALVGNLASSAVNVALNSEFNTQVAGPGGFPITSGRDLLASVVTPYVTSAISAGINQQIEQSLQSAGPFGPLLSQVGTGLVNQVFGGITGDLTETGTNSKNYKSFPGAGDEPKADYGGIAYTLGPSGGDVVFSIQPANQGPQAFGLTQTYDFPKTLTTLPFTEYTKMPPLAGSNTANVLKQSSMVGGLSKRAWDPKISGTFTSANFR